MNRMAMGIIFVALCALSGCVVSHDRYDVDGGVVTHNNSLTEANQKCISICVSVACPNCRIEPRLNQCTEKECQCLC